VQFQDRYKGHERPSPLRSQVITVSSGSGLEGPMMGLRKAVLRFPASGNYRHCVVAVISCERAIWPWMATLGQKTKN